MTSFPHRVRHIMLLAIVLAPIGTLNARQEHPMKISPLWLVHIDEVKPEQAPLFERLAHAQFSKRNEILRQHKLDLSMSYEFVTDAPVYFRCIPRDSFADFDHPRVLPGDVKKLIAERVNILDDSIHATLIAHHNEVWRFDPSSSYVPGEGDSLSAMPGYLRIHSECVIPGKDAQYDSTVDLIHEALVRTHAPLACLIFFSSYGDGTVHWLWLARERQEYLKAPDIGQVLVSAYGEKEGMAIYKRWQDCVIRVTDVDATPRPDMLDLSSERLWFGMPAGR